MDTVKNNAGYWLATFGKLVMVVVVAAFLGLHTINFFSWVFPDDQQMYSYLGFGLTGGALVVYLGLIKWGRLSPMSQAVALIMLAVSALGELAAAGFGMQIEAWKKAGWAMTQEDFETMMLVVQALGLAHAAALVVMFVGDDIAGMLGNNTNFSLLSKKEKGADESAVGGMFRGHDGTFQGVKNAKTTTTKAG